METPRPITSSPEPTPSGNARFFIVLVITVAVIVVLAAGAWWWQRSQAPARRVPATSVLMKINPAYAKAASLRQSGDLAGALASYQAALAMAQTPVQRSTIQFLIARMQLLTGDKIAAINTYKEIASTTDYSKIFRAYAIQTMGVLYYNNARDSEITKAVFTGDPYASFYDPQALDLSYRKLFNYAASFYPVAGAEYSIARWYFVQLKHAPATTSPALIQSYKETAQRRMAAGDTDLERLRAAAVASAFIPDALLEKARAESQAYADGLASSTDAEAAYRDALTVYDTGKHIPGAEWRARYEYAGFLASFFGARRQADIQTLLKPLYADPERAKLLDFLTLAKNSPFDASAPKALAQLAPQFKTLLLSNGWKESDLQ